MVGQNRGEERGKQVYTTQVHNLDTKLPCPGYEIKHGTIQIIEIFSYRDLAKSAECLWDIGKFLRQTALYYELIRLKI